MGKVDTSLFTNENDVIQPSKLGGLIIKERNIVHIKTTPTMNNSDALSTPLYSYNPKYGVYEGLTTKGKTPLEKIIYNYVDQLEISSSKMNDVIRYINANANILPYIDTNIVAFKNALYDIEHDAVLEKSPNIVTTTRMTGVEYNSQLTEHPLLDTFMKNLFCGYDDDNDMMRFVYESIGYCLANNTFAQKFFILYGEGGNGKSAFLDLLTRLLTIDNVSSLSLIDIDSSKFRLAEIMGKFANIGDDIESSSILNTANIKKIVTGDTIIIEHKGAKPYSYNPHAKLFFSCNSIPRIYDTSTGMRDRLLIIPMINRIRNTNIANPYIVRDIVSSNGLTVLLNRALDGLRRLRKQGHFTRPKRVDELTKAYAKENDHIALFLDEVENGEVQITPVYDFNSAISTDKDVNILKCIEDVKAFDLYLIYSGWAKACGYKPLSKHEFSKRMKMLGYTNSKAIRGKACIAPYKAWTKAEM